MPGPAEPVVLTLASFAVTKLAYVRLTKRFQKAYIAATGIDVRFRLTFAGSGVQVRPKGLACRFPWIPQSVLRVILQCLGEHSRKLLRVGPAAAQHDVSLARHLARMQQPARAL